MILKKKTWKIKILNKAHSSLFHSFFVKDEESFNLIGLANY